MSRGLGTTPEYAMHRESVSVQFSVFEPCCCAQDVGDMHILALLQQAQVQRAAEEALTSLDDSSRQAQIASEAQQDLDLKVMMLLSVIMLTLLS